MTSPAEAAAPCPCGSGRALGGCCGPLLDGAEAAATAEALMRSRYSAHVLARIDYLVATHDAEGRGAIDRAAVERWARQSDWQGLEIVARERGGAGDDEGIVEFKARYRDRRGALVVHHERSRFRREGGRWVYRDGTTPAVTVPARRAAAAAGRNEPCPCGSGKKYKRCCGAGA